LEKQNIRAEIEKGFLTVGIEFGSTRIKTVAIDSNFNTVASGYYEWENKLENDFWTYSVNDVWVGLQKSYSNMTDQIESIYQLRLKKIKSIGISAMMHGYLAFDEHDDLLVPFRTWRNNYTNEAAASLRTIFDFNIPERWSIAHLYQALLDKEPHIEEITYITTLAGYVHWYLTGEKVLGIGDASGMFPIDPTEKNYRGDLMEKFDGLLQTYGLDKNISSLLPEVLIAGDEAGCLTREGAKLLDPKGDLEAGIPFCPPEGDAGTGMVATNSIAVKTGNISAGTSAFAMIVLENSLEDVYPEIDIVTTPSGSEVAMVHTNNCTSDLNAWVNLFDELLNLLNISISRDDLYGQLMNHSLEGEDDLGGLLSFGFVSGENITDVSDGRPMFVRMPDSRMNLANFMKTHLYSSFSTMKIGIDLLMQREKIQIDSLVAHGGIFKTKGVAQNILAAATESPITVMETANDGGAWGMAILAKYMTDKRNISLEDYLKSFVFREIKASTAAPTEKDIQNYKNYIKRYKSALPLEQKASQFILGDD